MKKSVFPWDRQRLVQCGLVGAGYVWDIASKTALDLSAKYRVTHQNTGRVTLGVAIKPSAEMPLSFDLGLQGYTGKC